MALESDRPYESFLMLELTKSAISYSWAMSLFGAQQLAYLLLKGSTHGKVWQESAERS